MRSDDLLDLLGDVPEAWINEAGEAGPIKKHRCGIIAWVAASAAILGLVIFAAAYLPWGKSPEGTDSSRTAAENEYIAPAVPTLSPEADARLAELRAGQKESEKKVQAYLSSIRDEAQEFSQRIHLLPVRDRVCVYACLSGAYFGGSGEKAKRLSRQLEEIKGDEFLRQDEEVWYRLKDCPQMKYLILEDSSGLSLWQFSSLYTPDAGQSQDPDLVYNPEEDPFRAAYPDANFGAVSYGELYQFIYGLNGPEDILLITAEAPNMGGGPLAGEIREKIGTQTIADTQLIALFYEIIKDAPYNCGDPSRIDERRFTYAFSTDAKDKDASGESLWGGRYLTLTLGNGVTIDSLKYSALSGIFYEHGGILPSFLADEQVSVLNALFGIGQDGSAGELSEKGRLAALYNQAASRDCDRLQDYLDSHPHSELKHHFAGLWIGDDQRLTVLLSCEAPGCHAELESIGFERGAVIIRGDFGSYDEAMEILDTLNRGISRINQAVLDGQGTEAEQELMRFYPCTHYDHQANHVSVSVAAQDKASEARAIALFKELIGDYPAVAYYSLPKENVTGIDY